MSNHPDGTLGRDAIADACRAFNERPSSLDPAFASAFAILAQLQAEAGRFRGLNDKHEALIDEVRAGLHRLDAVAAALEGTLQALNASPHLSTRKCVCPPSGLSVWREGGICDTCKGEG